MTEETTPDTPKKKSKLKTILIALVLLVLLGCGTVAMWIDAAARAGVEYSATYALGVDTTLGAMDIGILAGTATMDDLAISNPEGFETPTFLVLDDGHVAVSLGTLMDDTVVIPEITLTGFEMNLESRKGKANYKHILDNLAEFESKLQTGEQPVDAESGPKKGFIIKKLNIENVAVNVELLPIGGQLSRMPVTVPGIQMTNIGSNSADGIELAQVIDIIIKAILQSVVDKAGHILPADIVSELGTGLAGLESLTGTGLTVVGDVATEAGKVVEEVGKVGEKVVEDVTEETGKVVEDVADEVGNAGKNVADEIGKGIGDLFGGKKKDGDNKKEEEQE